jgi:hypothetical protein
MTMSDRTEKTCCKAWTTRRKRCKSSWYVLAGPMLYEFHDDESDPP